MRLATIRQNILLIGPSGCGKTYLVEKMAEKLGLPFAGLPCSAGMSEAHIGGWLLPTEAHGRFAYAPSAFVQCYENGGVILFDEIDAADENTLLFINQALANGQFFLPQRFTQPTVTRHPDFVCVAAANTVGLGGSLLYAGRNVLDGATLDRFRAGVVGVEYSARVETVLVDAEVYQWALGIRRAIRERGMAKIMSTRVMLDYTKQKTVLGFTRKDWAASYFFDWTTDEITKLPAAYQQEARDAQRQ